MDFTARTARACVAHHPEVVLLATVHDVDLRVETGLGKESRPVIVSFLVELCRITRAGLIDGCIESRRRKLPPPNHQFPRPFNRFLLEVIAERPVAQHLEERVVIGVEANVVEVIVFAAGADAFLRVGRACVGCPVQRTISILFSPPVNRIWPTGNVRFSLSQMAKANIPLSWSSIAGPLSA